MYDILVVDFPMKELYKSDELVKDISVLLNSSLLDEFKVNHLKDITPNDLGRAHQIK